MTPQPTLQIENRGTIRILTMENASKRNATSFLALDDLEAAIAVSAKEGVRCLILRGAGNESFCSGFDISEMGITNHKGERPDEAVERVAAALERVACPTIAFLNGSAYGAGCELAATCDLRVARVGISLGMPPAKLGVVYPASGLRRFHHLLGAARTREMFLTGQPVDAERAYQWGLINRLIDADSAEAHALQLASGISNNAPLAVQGMKRVLNLIEASQERGLSDEDRKEVALLRRRAFASDDLLEGRKAFEERRAPKFQGK